MAQQAQVLAQRLRIGIDQGSETWAFARLGQDHLAGLATAYIGDAGDVGVQPGSEYEEVKGWPGAAQAVVFALSGRIKRRTGSGYGPTPDFDVAASAGDPDLRLVGLQRI